MADIAFVFHWPLSELDAMSIEDIGRWRELAAARHNPDKDD